MKISIFYLLIFACVLASCDSMDKDFLPQYALSLKQFLANIGYNNPDSSINGMEFIEQEFIQTFGNNRFLIRVNTTNGQIVYFSSVNYLNNKEISDQGKREKLAISYLNSCFPNISIQNDYMLDSFEHTEDNTMFRWRRHYNKYPFLQDLIKLRIAQDGSMLYLNCNFFSDTCEVSFDVIPLKNAEVQAADRVKESLKRKYNLHSCIIKPETFKKYSGKLYIYNVNDFLKNGLLETDMNDMKFHKATKLSWMFEFLLECSSKKEPNKRVKHKMLIGMDAKTGEVVGGFVF